MRMRYKMGQEGNEEFNGVLTFIIRLWANNHGDESSNVEGDGRAEQRGGGGDDERRRKI